VHATRESQRSRRSHVHSLIEGINNKIQVIKRMAYGFRDDVYFMPIG